MRRRRLGLCVLLLLCFSLEFAPPASADRDSIPWLTKSDDYTIVYYTAGHEADADLALGWMAEARAINERVLGETLQAKVYLHPSRASWPGGENLMEALDRERRFEMLTPSEYRQADTREAIPRIITHELAHLVSGQMRNFQSVTPHRWFWEGLADYVSIWGSGQPEWMEQTRYYEQELRAMAVRGDLNGFTIGSEYLWEATPFATSSRRTVSNGSGRWSAPIPATSGKIFARPWASAGRS